MADTAKTKRVCGKKSDAVDAFVIHHLEASLSVGSQLKQILATRFRNEPQRETTRRAIVARAVAILKPRDAGHNFTQRCIQVTQPNICGSNTCASESIISLSSALPASLFLRIVGAF